MTRLERIEKEIAGLSADELEDLRAWFLTFDGQNWEKAIERDVASGSPDDLANEALSEHKAGRSTAL